MPPTQTKLTLEIVRHIKTCLLLASIKLNKIQQDSNKSFLNVFTQWPPTFLDTVFLYDLEEA